MENFDAGPEGKRMKYERDDYVKNAIECMQKLLKSCTTCQRRASDISFPR